MRFAGTCSRYSNSAMPQLATAARYQGLSPRFLRCAYQAKVMKILESNSRKAVRRRTELTRAPQSGSSLPAPAGAEAGDMGHMVLPVPGVEGEHLVQSDAASVFRVPKPAGQLSGPEGSEEQYPAPVQRFQPCERRLHRSGQHIRELGPAGFVIGLDHRLVFGQRQLHPGIRIQMTVGNVVHHLTDSPALVSVWDVQLGGCQVGDCGSEGARSGGKLADPAPPKLRGHRPIEAET